MTRSLQLMADRLLDLGVTRVVMEATSSYWKPPFYLLETHAFQTWLVNAKDVKILPGQPKTDWLDAVWLCNVGHTDGQGQSVITGCRYLSNRSEWLGEDGGKLVVNGVLVEFC